MKSISGCETKSPFLWHCHQRHREKHQSRSGWERERERGRKKDSFTLHAKHMSRRWQNKRNTIPGFNWLPLMEIRSVIQHRLILPFVIQKQFPCLFCLPRFSYGCFSRTAYLLIHMLGCVHISAGGNSLDGKGHFSQRPLFHYMLSLVDGWAD